MKTSNAIVSRIKRLPTQHVFTAKDMADLGSRAAVDQVLHRLSAAGGIRRIGWGLYDKPKYSKLLGIDLSPDPASMARAIARKQGYRMLPSGPQVLNQLGLSTQVPGRHVYDWTGPSRKYKLGNTSLEFRRVKASDATSTIDSAKVVQVMKSFARNTLDEQTVSLLLQRLALAAQDVNKDTKYVDSRVHDLILKAAKDLQ